MPKKPSPTQTRRTLSLEEMSDLIPDLLLIESWVGAVKVQIHQALEDGEEVPGADLVPKRAYRKWTVEEAALIARLKKTLGSLGKPASDDDVAPRKVISPAEAEKAIGKANFADLLADAAKAEPSGFNLVLTPKT